MKIRFWGTRGSIPKPDRDKLRYGGNTSCVELRSASGVLIVIDCGSGAQALGQSLLAEGGGAASGALLISHTHWDHIQGLPFFAPLFGAGNEWDVYAPRGLSNSLRDTLSGQMQYDYFPVTLEEMGATIRYHELVEGRFSIGDVQVTAQYLDHPALTLGYRFEVDGVVFVYACDHEPPSRKATPDEADLAGVERRHIEFLSGADVVIHDAQYTAAEYPDKVGWGHSAVDYAAAVCKAAGVKHLALTHHDPNRTDDQIDEIVANIRRAYGDGALEIFGAVEGETIELAGTASPSIADTRNALPAEADVDEAIMRRRLALGTLRPEADAVLRAAAEAEGIALADGSDASAAVVVLDPQTAPAEVEAAASGPRDDEAPGLVLIRSQDEEAAALADRSPEWMVWPFSQQYAQTRIKSLLLRTKCRWIRAEEPAEEEQRLEALRHLKLLDSAPEERFDRITRMASAAFDIPIVLVSLIDQDRQWLKSCYGADTQETTREVALCSHTILQREPMVIPDTLLDARFADNPMVASGPRVRFYAGFPLRSKAGFALGTLCLIDMRPRGLSESEIALLSDFGQLAEEQINAGAP